MIAWLGFTPALFTNALFISLLNFGKYSYSDLSEFGKDNCFIAMAISLDSTLSGVSARAIILPRISLFSIPVCGDGTAMMFLSEREKGDKKPKKVITEMWQSDDKTESISIPPLSRPPTIPWSRCKAYV